MFFMKQLFRDYEVHHHTVQLIFSVTFALSCIMFELIIFEILGILDARYDFLNKNNSNFPSITLPCLQLSVYLLECGAVHNVGVCDCNHTILHRILCSIKYSLW